jgi:hypothetical protein
LNGCIDALYEAPHYSRYAINNTYGIKAINETTYNEQLASFIAPDGCAAAITACRELANKQDPLFTGSDEETNLNCTLAFSNCFSTMGLGVFSDVRSPSLKERAN